MVAEIFLAAKSNELKPLTLRTLRNLERKYPDRTRLRHFAKEGKGLDCMPQGFTIMIDGLLGMQCQPPLRPPYPKMINWANAQNNIHLRAAVDLPSGLSDAEAGETAFRADFTYATGIAKTPLFALANRPNVGRIRYLDLGFFSRRETAETQSGILLPQGLHKLKRLRDPQSDKRSHGHLFLLGGAPGMGGALMMATLAAVRSGLGLATAATATSHAAALTTVCPEAMTIAWPENANGRLAQSGLGSFMAQWHRAHALLLGPGLIADDETVKLLTNIIEASTRPLVLDAGALHPQAIAALAKRPAEAGPVLLTPHQGEFCRLAGFPANTAIDDAQLLTFCAKHQVITLLKGPVTRLCDGRRLMHSPFGGPVLARGGSGDILAGLAGSLFAQAFAQDQGETIPSAATTQTRAWEAASQALVWHGLAAEALACNQGQDAVRTTALLDFLAPVLRAISF